MKTEVLQNKDYKCPYILPIIALIVTILVPLSSLIVTEFSKNNDIHNKIFDIISIKDKNTAERLVRIETKIDLMLDNKGNNV